MKNIFTRLMAIWNIPLVSRALHTAWQAAIATLIVTLTSSHSSINVKLALIAALGAGLSAAKTMFVAYIQGLRS